MGYSCNHEFLKALQNWIVISMSSKHPLTASSCVCYCTIRRLGNGRRTNETMRLIVTTFAGIVFGFFLGASFPTLSLTKMNLPSSLFPSLDLAYIEDKYSGLSTQALLNIWSSLRRNKGTKNPGSAKIWVPTNPGGAERLAPGIIESEWYAKRFLHPSIVATYDYIFIWDEDLGVENFDPEEYIKLVRKHGLEISQPGLEPNGGFTWQMTKKRDDSEVHKFVEIMAPVFSRDAWRCVWHMIQPAHKKIGVVDAQWIVHQTVPSLGNQGKAENGKAPWEGVRERCRTEWKMFQDRINAAERIYFEAIGIDPPNSTIV
ncbi:hypothetical protein RHGRI_028163 [Rhododendron griersonianum]|uniref:Uncharacterized protein n=1 Tax=Rhododendron griersonianum TaxID=479676 RepID=A0AAV6IIL1_9ERIC|nr:hypothetical protein RHGRI_028163 [Rhododendron griersonianum]